MQIFSIIGPLATIAGLVSAAVTAHGRLPFRLNAPGHRPSNLNPGPVVLPPPVMPNGRENIGRISDPLAHSSRKGNLAKRADPGFYFCTNAEYTGLCFRDQSAFGTCGMCPILICAVLKSNGSLRYEIYGTKIC